MGINGQRSYIFEGGGGYFINTDIYLYAIYIKLYKYTYIPATWQLWGFSDNIGSFIYERRLRLKIKNFAVLRTRRRIMPSCSPILKKRMDMQTLVSAWNQSRKAHLTSKLKYRRSPSYLLCTLLLFPFNFLPSPVYPTGFYFCFFPGFLTIFALMSSNNNIEFKISSTLSLHAFHQ